ncbi:MAG: sugar phosphate isomerase/epimerase [Pseudomonadota bacterium]|nr:sugar phosphate isomerase/epimerase [Pseudomonadota bacterium]
MASRLRVYQALWAMTGLVDPEPAIGDKFDRVLAAGFDGMAIDLGALTMEQAQAAVPHFARTGLGGALTAFPASIEDLRPALTLAHRIGAPYVVVIGQVMPLRVADMVPVIEGWLRVAEQEGMPILFETHRNCITNDLFSTVQLLDAIPAMRLAADLSHYVVDREMPCPPTPALQALFARVLERSDSFQGRVAARGQIQIALGFAQHAKWVELFRHWWRQGFTAWAARHATTAQDLVFLCELGPPDYAITDAAGRELSDRWAESLLLKDWAHELWRTATAAPCSIG